MNNITRKNYRVKIRLKSPIHINSGIGGPDYQLTVKRDNIPIIPGSTIKGKMRDNFARLMDGECLRSRGYSGYCNCPLCSIFGNGGFQPARIFIGDFVPEERDMQFGIRPKIAIDRFRRVAADGALTKTEVIEAGTFYGNIEVYFTPGTEKYEKQLLLSIKMIETIGGGKSRGWGFADVEVEPYEQG